MLREDYNIVEGIELSPVDWDDHQDPSLGAIIRTVEFHIEQWYNRKLRQLQSQRVVLTYEKMKLEEEDPVESVGQKGGGSSQQQRANKGKKRKLEVEKDKEHQEPPAKKQNTVLSRESMIEAKNREVKVSGQDVTVEVSSDSESSGYSNSTEYSPLFENQNQDDMTSTSKEEGRPIDIEEVNQTPKARGDALLVEPNSDLGRYTAPLWLRQMLMPRSEVVTVRTVEDIQGLAEKEDNTI